MLFHASLVVALAAAAPAQSSPIRAGTYDLEITYGGGVLEGRLELALAGDSATVTLHVGDHASPIKSVKRAGNKLTLSGGPEMKVEYQLTFTGDSVAGTFTFNGSEGSLTGTRRKQG